VQELQLQYLGNIINDIVKSKVDTVVIFMDESNSVYQLIDKKGSSKIKYILISRMTSF